MRSVSLPVRLAVALALSIVVAGPPSTAAAAAASPRCSDVRLKPIDTGGSAGVTAIAVVTSYGPHQSSSQNIAAKYGIGMRAYKLCSQTTLTALDIGEFVAVGNEPHTALNHVRARAFAWDASRHIWQELHTSAPVAVPSYPQCNCPDKVAAYDRAVQNTVERAANGG